MMVNAVDYTYIYSSERNIPSGKNGLCESWDAPHPIGLDRFACCKYCENVWADSRVSNEDSMS